MSLIDAFLADRPKPMPTHTQTRPEIRDLRDALVWLTEHEERGWVNRYGAVRSEQQIRRAAEWLLFFRWRHYRLYVARGGR